MFAFHHIVCMTGITMALRMSHGGIFAGLGIFALEWGSGPYNVWAICTDKKLMCECAFASIWKPLPRSWLDSSYFWAMTGSNVVSAGCLVESCRREFVAGNIVAAGIALVMGLILQCWRQKDCSDNTY